MAKKVVLSGSSEILKPLLPQIIEFNLLLEEMKSLMGNGSNRPPISPDFDDYLQLTICWNGKIIGTKRYHRVEKSISLKAINPRTVTLEQLQELARRVKTKFNNLNFTTGHCKVKYANYKDGFRTWGYFDNKETGYRIIEAMGDIINKSIDRKRLRVEYVDDVSAFDPNPNKIPLANQMVRPPQQAPIAAMKFTRANLLFPWIGHNQLLCDNKGFIVSSLHFLQSYE